MLDSAYTDTDVPLENILSNTRVIHLEGHQLQARTFLLGNEGGMVLHLPVELNVGSHTMLPIKWFGASEFGRKYLEADRVWIDRGGNRTLLSRSNQYAFEQDLSEAVRIFHVDGVAVRQRFFVPRRLAGFVMILECDRPTRFIVEPQYDMRYYQAFNTDFSGYSIRIARSDQDPVLHIGNEIEGPDGGAMTFHSTIRAVGSPLEVQLQPEDDRFLARTYLKDEHREKLIHRAYAETDERSPDEAPIWDSYRNTVFVPAHLVVNAPATLVYSVNEDEAGAESSGACIAASISDLVAESDEAAIKRLDQGLFQTGNASVDLAYNQVLTRFNTALVARDVNVQTGSQKIEHFTAIFAGDKYFLDAWKRDENISLEALLLGNDFATVRTILDNTWQFQDDHTGRLPHIIRLGEPLVYFCSDGTLWALRRLFQYSQASGDTSLLNEKWGMVEHFFEASLGFVRRGLLPSGGIVERSYLWETWEDTAHTPRDGYPVEIELLWLAALKQYLPLVQERNPCLAERLADCLEEGERTFETFYLNGYLADSLDYSFRPRELLTPNGYIAFSLDYPVPGSLARQMVLTARHQLAGRVGVKGLARRDWPSVFPAKFLDDPANVRNGNMASVGIYNYHRGIEWLWLNPYLVRGEVQYGDTDIAYRTYVEGQVRSAVEKSGVGGLDELSDLHGPLGADFQAWSMAGFVASLHEFAGVKVDAAGGRIAVRPCIPVDWPDLLVRRRIQDCRFDVRMRIEEGGTRLITLALLDPPPRRLQLEAGIRLPPTMVNWRVAVNGKRIAPEAQELRLPSGDDGPGELWVRAPLEGAVRIEFLPS